jgi:hypothetical protein
MCVPGEILSASLNTHCVLFTACFTVADFNLSICLIYGLLCRCIWNNPYSILVSILWPTVSLGVMLNVGPMTGCVLLLYNCEFVDVGCPLWREDGPVVCNCFLPSPAKSRSDSSPAELTTIFYCLRFETLHFWSSRSPYLYPPGTG